MAFNDESVFEESLIKVLSENGWEKEVIKYPTEKDLIKNWANILFENNRSIDRLNDYPLTDGEMQQVIEQIETLKTPVKLNGFINGKTVTIRRDNKDDQEHFGKEVSLKIYDRREIAAGTSRYQIVQQPRFSAKSKILNCRRGDLMLLINGMPVIHIELKKSGTSISQATDQIAKYSHEGVFTGLFSLVQIFVAMTPEETLYFANPGADGKFNPDFYFHWADFYNMPINDWKKIASNLLSIPMAHMLIGFYTVADDSDGVLKVMRSYQYYAASKISDRVATNKWEKDGQRGGYIWHTTGSGKTMTSFKSAQLIASSKDADKVIFLIDRIELGTQSLKEYRGFADENQSVQETENTSVLITKLKSSDPADTLIVTSIQKMSNINDEGNLNADDIELINKKRMVFIVDECHRSTFGDMLHTVKKTFPRAMFFGFTGTPIFEENSKNNSCLTDVFGDELHRYSIADGIRDKNVLGFDPYMILTYKDNDVRKAVALDQARAETIEEALKNEQKSAVYNYYMNKSKVGMAGHFDENNKYVKGIEDFLPKAQYNCDVHRNAVVDDIIENWVQYSQAGKFHALFATSSITEAIKYYRLFKEKNAPMKVTALFDPNIDNNEGAIFKEDGLVEIIKDYNETYHTDYSIPTADKFKKDIASRLAHKKPYERISNKPEEQINLLIVVDQMLTGFDSKWINTLYLDKILRYENLIQAFSRTNRLFGPDKPFGTIRYYRMPHTMARNIETAVKTFSGDKPMGLFVQKLDKNLEKMNFIFNEIKDLFLNSNIENFEKLPEEKEARGKFANLFKQFNEALESAKVQGFIWERLEYKFTGESKKKYTVNVDIDENTFLILASRYKELFKPVVTTDGPPIEDPPFEIEPYLIEIDTGHIDTAYMDSRFKKYIGLLQKGDASEEELESTLNELHKTFASLSQERQKFANVFLHDIQSGTVEVISGKTLSEYINEYIEKAKNDQIHKLSEALGLDESKLRNIMASDVTESNINEFGRFDSLKSTVDKSKAKVYFESVENKPVIMPMVPQKVDSLLRQFIMLGGFEIEET